MRPLGEGCSSTSPVSGLDGAALARRGRVAARGFHLQPLDPAAPRPFDPPIRYGTFLGACRETAFAPTTSGLGRLARLLREKRWQYFAVADEAVAVGGAIVDLGYAGNAFLWAVERETGLLHEGETLSLPTAVHVGDVPGDGLEARIGGSLAIRTAGGRTEVVGRLGAVEVAVALEAAGEALTAVAPVEGGGVNVTCKHAALRGSGSVVLGERRLELGQGASGILDYSHGLLARETSWRWAAGAGRLRDGNPIGFNLVEGFNQGLENGIWVRGRPRPVGAARFTWDPKAPEAPWQVTTDDGVVDLLLEVEAVRRKDLHLGIAASWYRQPVGRWTGQVDGQQVDGIFGVAEDHKARW